MSHSILPELGQVFRSIVTDAGHRPRLEELGLGKDLDDLAQNNRPSTSADLLLALENRVQQELANDCGEQWANLLRWHWGRARETIQQLSREIETTPLSHEQGAAAVRSGFAAPMLAWVMRFAHYQFPGIDVDVWWRSPMAAWIKLVSNVANVKESDLLGLLHDTPRTTERWMSGEPVGELRFPHRASTLRCLGRQAGQLTVEQADLLTGWLTLAVSYQSVSKELREEVRRRFSINDQQPWSPGTFIAELQRTSHDAGPQDLWAKAEPLAAQIAAELTAKQANPDDLERKLGEYQVLIRDEQHRSGLSYQYIHDRIRARLAAQLGERDKALDLYSSVVDSMWWRAGRNQEPILQEALLYAVGVGEVEAAKRYWDKTFLLGLNRWPKRPLDEHERRRLAFGFEQVFAPQLAHDRVPPKVEVLVRDEPFELTSKQLKSPNAKVKHANGRTRRTPLMDAVREGTLQDVKQAIAAGGDPNDFVRESGEGPLTYAMRRACDRRDTIIMDYLLRMELTRETVNRAASTSRETPLKIAIEMADAAAVERLVVLGADVEHACDYVPSALVYAMSLMYSSLHRDDMTQQRAYLEGRTRADVHDAKDGVALDMQLASRRMKLARLREASPIHEQIFKEVMDWFVRPPEPCRRVVRTLLRLGANANRSYKVEHEHLAEWTPTLFGAQLGDLEVFRALLEHGGDPNAVLMQSSSLDRQDAMWVAVSHSRHAIVEYLMRQGQQTTAR
jgi:ankyrin repeat protein